MSLLSASSVNISKLCYNKTRKLCKRIWDQGSGRNVHWESSAMSEVTMEVDITRGGSTVDASVVAGKKRDVDVKDVKLGSKSSSSSAAALRWSLLGRFISSKIPENRMKGDKDLGTISRRPAGRFNVIQCAPACSSEDGSGARSEHISQRESLTQYIVSSDPSISLSLWHRKDSGIGLYDFIVSQKHDIDSTGLSCSSKKTADIVQSILQSFLLGGWGPPTGMWPAEEILTYYCISRLDIFRNKRVIELGAGNGLAGLAIAACSEASEVLLTDGNPQVVEYIEKNIILNSGTFGDTRVRACTLHWSRHQAAMPGLKFDLIVAADCTFFKDFHLGLAHTLKGLLGTNVGCQAILFNPRRGDSLNRFIEASQSVELKVDIHERYDSRIWDLHQGFLKSEAGSQWPNYDEDHCYPILLSITHLSVQGLSGQHSEGHR